MLYLNPGVQRGLLRHHEHPGLGRLARIRENRRRMVAEPDDRPAAIFAARLAFLRNACRHTIWCLAATSLLFYWHRLPASASPNLVSAGL
ncbi:MAG: hypothetical protein H7A53_03370 [Akkermansiaceae bacterium]|nr:hypothetical protein [Akkermansiaceae bacterium]